MIFIKNCIILVSFSTTGHSDTQILSNVKNNDRLEEIKKKGVLTVASSNELPFVYVDPNTNEITGIDGEIIKEVAKRLGINKVVIKEVPFEKFLTQLNTDDDIDIVADGMAITDERKKEALFTNVIYKESEAIVTPKVSKVVFKENLKDAVVGVQKETTFFDLAQSSLEK